MDSSSVLNEFLIRYPVVKAFLAGSFSGTFSTILFQPLDLVKTRLQNPQPAILKSASDVRMITIFATVVQQDKIFGLWKGMTPSITRCVPGVGLYFCSLDWLKSHYVPGRTPTPLESITLGAVARCMSAGALIPITVVKTRYESGVYQYESVGSALRHIYHTEGLKGMTCGLIPTLVRDAPYSGLYFMFYTQMKLLVPQKHLNSSFAAPIHFTCGIAAGIMASVITQPADVLKTKMQLYPNKFHSLLSAIVHVHSKYGFAGYFKGMVPRMLRRTLVTAMAWTIYEQVTKNIGLK
ncbi:mitochondrial glycine transporter A isoform X2 [Agrilus planipennis]|uniref:Mitochondrial glycine transporter n=1 Tax=Agrilus planipennis TaxID=224129 RepID=A0A7F5RAW5_AGRPL|nr:mitochondrial glycine transporter A isoform X2 [Agrilus planipennis]